MRPIEDVAADLGFTPADLQPWGPGVAKIKPETTFGAGSRTGTLVLVSAINPTPAGGGRGAGPRGAPPGAFSRVPAPTPAPAGEGKTTGTIGLPRAARRLGARAACALREPSLG